MSIRSVLNNTVSSMKDSISDILNKSKNNLSDMMGPSSIHSVELPGKGFVGMSEEGMNDLYAEIRKYINSIEEVIDSYNYEEVLSGAYKGAVREKVNTFLESSKALLKGYVGTLNKSIEEAQNAFITYKEATEAIANDAETDAEQVRSEANKIDL